MSLKLKIANLILIIAFLFGILFALYDFLFIKISFLKKFNQKTIILDRKISDFKILLTQYNNAKLFLNKDSHFSSEIAKYLDENKRLSNTLEREEFEKFFYNLINSKSIIINKLIVDVNVDFPLIFNSKSKANISLDLEVGDIIDIK
ncbi:MAG: hypothetical protein PWQ83_739 [Thermosipho sp. (in: thermotogales)]|nr:hypothetical protein [Thermosipho sp. (in: thermotogales)]MDK2900397.1 hypothetical protein [Thermosipho sp. (in: thermotogales)]